LKQEKLPILGGYITSDGTFITLANREIQIKSSLQRDVLKALVEAKGEVVPHWKLMGREKERDLSSKDEESLRTAIKELRGQLGGELPRISDDWQEEDTFSIIVTEPKRGYRLQVPVLENRIPASRLMELEAIRSEKSPDGELECGSEVFVHSSEPYEATAAPEALRFANTVVANLRGGVRYRYFMRNEAHKVAQLVAALWRAAVAPSGRTLTEGDYKAFLNNLRVFLLCDFLPFDFCIHNAADQHRCKCYLRMNESESLFWGKGDPVLDIVKSQRATILRDHGERRQIIQGTTSTPLSPQLTKAIRSELRDQLEPAFANTLRTLVEISLPDYGTRSRTTPET
jgi:DNA-binding winged helix-turn-helix (wHTH) protein